MFDRVKLSKFSLIYILLSIFICLVSCDPEQITPTEDDSPITGKPVKVHINLMGAEFENYEEINADVQASYGGLNFNEKPEIFSEKYAINPSTMIQTNVISNSHSSQKFRMSYLKPGKMFRVIVYKRRSGLSYYTHKDYVVGKVVEPLILEQNVVYTIVAYSYDSESLPMITSKERENIRNQILNYDDSKRNFMAVKIPNYVAKNDVNMLNVILKHKISQFIVKLESYIGNIDKIEGAKIYPHHKYGIIDLDKNEIRHIERETFDNIKFPKGSNQSFPVFINANTKGEKTGMFSMNIVIDGKQEKLNLFNLFKVAPGTSSQINIEFKKCGAYLGPNRNDWREFMCHNLGANYNSDPFTPSPNLHGAKYQWGNKTPAIKQVEDQDPENDVNVMGWTKLEALPRNSWIDAYKTKEDPCPDGYRLPSKEEWDRIVTYNDVKSIGNWEESVTNYSSGTMIGDKLFLPNEGFRRYKDARIVSRGKSGMYWTASNTGEYKYVAHFEQGDKYHANKIYQEDILSIRCMKE